MPPLSQKLGILFAPHHGRKYSEQLSHEHEIADELIAQLPDRISFAHRFHENFTNWLPFHWAGFQQTTRYTYLLRDLQPASRIWKEMRGLCRRNIRKAVKQGLKVRDDLPIERFAALHDQVFMRQSLEPPYSNDLILRLDEVCARQSCRKILGAVDSAGRVHAAAYLVWDNQTAYYLMGGSDPELRESGGLRLAQWEAIQFSASIAQQFDFEGSMIRTVETACRSFGARQVPYFLITKRNPPDPRSRMHPSRLSGGILRRLAHFVDPDEVGR
jgi:lipid II:glycine glycyltransferase (peptidoglycan interpeptide bridge formation enzyme)